MHLITALRYPCTFKGPLSQAAKGECTNTAGYISNAEIGDIISTSDASTIQKWHDATTDSDYLIYDNTEWVAYMGKDTKASRTAKYKSFNFGGTSDWAIDLQSKWPDAYDVDGDYALDTDGTDEPFDFCDGSYSSIDDIPDSVSGRCAPVYVTGALSKELYTALKDYTEVSKGYDDKFKWYVDWVKESIDPALDDFMQVISGEGNKYMDCKWHSKNDEGSGPCTEVILRVNGPHMGSRVIEYTMRDEAGFYKALAADHGIDKTWVSWEKEYAVNDICPCPNVHPGLEANNAEGQVEERSLPCSSCATDYIMYKNYPRRIDDTSKIDVPNPKQLIDDAIPKTKELATLMSTTYQQMWVGELNASSGDAATAFSMPIFMLEDAIESIKTVKAIGEKQKKTKTRELIINILTIVFAIIPFVGEATVALGGAAMIARAALIVGEAGNAALTIVEVVDDPLSAPFAIIGMLIGAKGIKIKGPRQAFKDAADARRALNAGKMKLFSDEFRRKDGIVQAIPKKQCSI
ncbi:hypothetical protein G7046_g3877 [Stylonectria norvegica]|nr:hypothetical protein G7046_g3877 [Stylonectria norvegica]